MKIIDKTVLSRHEPKNTNVMWAEPVEEGVSLHIFNNDEWNNLSGESYKKPEGGIPEGDLSTSVNAKLEAAVTAVQASQRGVANGVATLNSEGTIPISQLPSYTYNIVERSSASLFPTIGESGKIYVDTGANTLYRWDGTKYISVSNPKNIDSSPTAGSENLVTSGGVKTALDAIWAQLNNVTYIGEVVDTVDDVDN